MDTLLRCLVIIGAATAQMDKVLNSEVLNLMYSNLSHIPDGSEQVEFLNLAYNHITCLEDHVFSNNSFRNLKKLHLFKNNISNVSATAFKGLKHLRVADLSNNNITTLDPYTFKTNGRLDRLIMMNNIVSFERLQTFLVSHTIETLILTNNRITEIYGLTFIGLPNLKRLILTDNPLTMLSPLSFKNQRKLHFLSLANTGVHKLTETMFLKIPRVINLDETPLAKRFEPPLHLVTDESVTALLKINELVY